MQDMTTRGGHYTALVETIGARGATKLHADEREQLLAVADALLFGDPDSEQRLAPALDLIARLRDSERLSPQNCARAARAPLRLRTAPRWGLNEAADRPASGRDGIRCPTPRGGPSIRAGRDLVRSRRWGSELLDLPGAGCAVAVAAVVVTSANTVESWRTSAREACRSLDRGPALGCVL
jgi:hypothetical protein